MALKHQLLALPKRIEPANIDGIECYVKRMSGRERDEYTAALFEADKKRKDIGDAACIPLQAKLLKLTVCDRDGKAAFDEDDEKEIGELDSSVIEKLVERASDVNALSEKSRAELAKKS